MMLQESIICFRELFIKDHHLKVKWPFMMDVNTMDNGLIIKWKALVSWNSQIKIVTMAILKKVKCMVKVQWDLQKKETNLLESSKMDLIMEREHSLISKNKIRDKVNGKKERESNGSHQLKKVTLIKTRIQTF